MANREEVGFWLKYANMDRETIKGMSNHYPLQLEIICYHCQQACEKMLKAYLVSQNIEPKKTHDLEALLALCVEKDKEFESLITECSFLTPYAVQSRYPNELETLEHHMEKAKRYTEKICSFIKEKMK